MTLKIRNIYFTILSVIILSMVTLLDVNAQAPAANTRESAKVFVQKFYDWYTGVYNNYKPKRSNPAPADIIALKQKPDYFDASLRNAILEDEEAQAKISGEVVGLDGDPFLNTQDTGFQYQAGAVKQAGNKFLVDVHYGPVGRSKKRILASDITTIAEVVNVNGHWQFTNFYTPLKMAAAIF